MELPSAAGRKQATLAGYLCFINALEAGQERHLHLDLDGYSLHDSVLKHLGLLVFQLENILLFEYLTLGFIKKGSFVVVKFAFKYIFNHNS